VSTTLSRELARLIRTKSAGEDDRREAVRFVRDWLGSAVAGRATDPGRRLRRTYGRVEGIESAVFLAAALSHITETDDLHRGSITHPGCVVVPVALILGRSLGRSEAAILGAVLAGYEAMLRIGEALGPAHYRIFHNTATAGPFGAAAAAAALLDLGEDQWVWAFGSAGTQAAGLWQFNADAAMSKPLHAAHAAQAGLRAALLAAEGFTGAEAILEGDRGFFRALCPDPRVDRVLAPSPGWKLLETSLKPYPSCRHTHPAIDAALSLRAQAQALDAPLRVDVESYPAALDLTDNPDPRTTAAAKFSLQYCVAATLLHGRPGLATFDGPSLEDRGVRDLLDRVRVTSAADLAAAYPDRWGARVTLRRNGIDTTAAQLTAKGDPEDPLTDQAVEAKARDLMRHGGWDENRIEAGWSRPLELDVAAVLREGS
jgi:2-methylcitrate dehydratase PrpD